MGSLKQLKPGLAVLKPKLAWLNEDKAAASRARDRVVEWRWMYKTKEWRRLRWQVLVRDRFTCAMCGLIEADTSKLVGDHIKPHKGDVALFYDMGNLQCVCVPCHNGAKQRQERAGLA